MADMLAADAPVSGPGPGELGFETGDEALFPEGIKCPGYYLRDRGSGYDRIDCPATSCSRCTVPALQ